MKKIFTTAALSLCLAATAANAADVDFSDKENTYVMQYATELVDAGDKITVADNVLFELGYAVPESTTPIRYVRIDLSGDATFADTLTGANFVVTEAVAAVEGVEAVEAVEADPDNGVEAVEAVEAVAAVAAHNIIGVIEAADQGDGYVVFSVKAVDELSGEIAALTKKAQVVFSTGTIKLGAKGAVSATSRVFETVTQANDADSPLATVSGKIIDFASALTYEVEPGEKTPQINVNDENKLFTDSEDLDGKEASFGGISIGLTLNDSDVDVVPTEIVFNPETGAPINFEILGDDATITIKGDFSAIVKDKDNLVAEANFQLNDVAVEAPFSPSALTFDLDGALANAVVKMTVDGETALAESLYTYKVDLDNPEMPTHEADLYSLTKNGATANLKFAVDPNGEYPYYIRISNTSGLAGEVMIKLINDDGLESDYFDLADVKGYDSSELAAGASTQMISIQDLLAAALDTDNDFAVAKHKNNHLRIKVDSTIPEGEDMLNLGGYAFDKGYNYFTELQ